MVQCNLLSKSCGCGTFTIKKFPCIHALVLLHHIEEKAASKLTLKDLCDPYYHATTGIFQQPIFSIFYEVL